jgi:tRNA-2-methylthio-N6-dimethylallyladenosine synthase
VKLAFSILSANGYNTTQVLEEADLVLVNTCSIRDKAEQTVRKRLEKYSETVLTRKLGFWLYGRAFERKFLKKKKNC